MVFAVFGGKIKTKLSRGLVIGEFVIGIFAHDVILRDELLIDCVVMIPRLIDCLPIELLFLDFLI